MFWSVEEFCDGFLKLIDHLELDKVRIVLTCAIMSHFATMLYVCPTCTMYVITTGNSPVRLGLGYKCFNADILAHN